MDTGIPQAGPTVSALLSLPAGLVVFSAAHKINPATLAQNLLEEHGREYAELLMERSDPGDERLLCRIALN